MNYKSKRYYIVAKLKNTKNNETRILNKFHDYFSTRVKNEEIAYLVIDFLKEIEKFMDVNEVIDKIEIKYANIYFELEEFDENEADE